MHLEVQVALNFVISYLYNKLPRRRVNIFGEELEKALKEKFRGHWYPEKPFKGSAFRCLKTCDPVDTVFERAARESGVPITDILENLPQDLSIWVDPGEVSYRIGEKGTIKILYNEQTDVHEEANADREVIKTFNPEAQCFRPIDAVLGALSLSPKGSPPLPADVSPTAGFKAPGGSPSPVAPNTTFIPRSTAPLTFTTATFAQTKFGSTKLKTNSKRANRMSPTEFSNYIKQRAMQQQQGCGGAAHHHAGSAVAAAAAAAAAANMQQQPPQAQHNGSSPGGHRSLSPSSSTTSAAVNPQDYLYPPYYRPTTLFDSYHPANDLYPKLSFLEPTQYHYPVASSQTPPPPQSSSASTTSSSSSSSASSINQPVTSSQQSQQDNSKQQQQLLESLTNFSNYSPNQYQHLLVAN